MTDMERLLTAVTSCFEKVCVQSLGLFEMSYEFRCIQKFYCGEVFNLCGIVLLMLSGSRS